MPADRRPAVLVYRTAPSYRMPYAAWKFE